MDRKDEKPIRILRLIARLNIGGPAIQTLTLTRALSADGYRSLLACGTISPWEGDMAYLAEDLGIQPHFIEAMGREISPYRDVKALLKLRRIIRRFKPHILHTHTAKAGFLGRFAALSVNRALPESKRIRMVHTFHGHTFHSYFSRHKTLLFICVERFLARFTNRIVVISRRQKEDICHNYHITDPKKVTIIPLGFDLSPFKNVDSHRQPMRRRYLSGLSVGSREPSLVGIIGRLTPVKNHRLLLNAVRILKDTDCIRGFGFVIVGDGELRDSLEREIDALGIGDSIVFTGWQREMAPVYAGLDAVVLTSDNEGTPVTLIEAMAAGKPIVATNVGGVPDLVGDVKQILQGGIHLADRGILVEKQDPGALAGALVYLDEHRKISDRMVGTAKTYAHRVFSMERLIDNVKSLYAELS